MPILTLISRVSDGLLLCASLDAMDSDLEPWTNKGRAILKRIVPASPPIAQLDTDSRYFLYMIRDNVCFLSLFERSYPKKLAFAFLDELQKEYSIQFDPKEVDRARRAYEHIKFDQFIQKTKKLYVDASSQRNMSKVAQDLTDVHRIMTRNIEEILGRGQQMSKIQQRSERLLHESQAYEKAAHKIASQLWWRTYGPFIGAGGLVVLILFVWFFYL